MPSIPAFTSHYAQSPSLLQLYEAGTYKLGGALLGKDGEADDGNLYFEDAIWRPSYIADVYNGKAEDFQRSRAGVDELQYLREMAEKYEEHLYASVAQESEDQAKGKKDRDRFNPEVFDNEEEEEKEGRKGDGKSRKK